MNILHSSPLRSASGPWSLGSGGSKPTGSNPSGSNPSNSNPQAANSPAAAAGAGAAANQAGQIQLTRHEKRSFVGQTLHLAGNAFVDCSFDSCTLVLTNSPFIFSGQCRVQRCNWRIEYDILWGAPAMRAQLRQILDSMDSATEAPTAV